MAGIYDVYLQFFIVINFHYLQSKHKNNHI